MGSYFIYSQVVVKSGGSGLAMSYQVREIASKSFIIADNKKVTIQRNLAGNVYCMPKTRKVTGPCLLFLTEDELLSIFNRYKLISAGLLTEVKDYPNKKLMCRKASDSFEICI